MSSSQFRTALKLRLGASFTTLPTHCCCPQRTLVCPKATHLFCCNELKPLHLMRHNGIKDDVMELARTVGFRATDSGLSRLNEENGRQGDTLFSGLGRHNLDLVVDYCVANACAPSYVSAGSSSTEGFAMKRLETMKYDKYKTMYARAGVDFMLLAVEMHGAISDTFLKLLKKLASDAADHIGTPYCIMFSYWQRRISTTLQKMNANILYLATCKIAREQHHGPGFVDYHRVMNEEQNFHRGN